VVELGRVPAIDPGLVQGGQDGPGQRTGEDADLEVIRRAA